MRDVQEGPLSQNPQWPKALPTQAMRAQPGPNSMRRRLRQHRDRPAKLRRLRSSVSAQRDLYLRDLHVRPWRLRIKRSDLLPDKSLHDHYLSLHRRYRSRYV